MAADFGYIEPERLKRLLCRMIDIYSPSGKEEELLDYLYGYLKRHDLPVQKQRLTEGRYNLIVAPQEEIKLCFIGHLDTVIAYDLDNYGYKESGDIISGLGASDMKGGCAAMIEAFISLWKLKQKPPPVALVLVVGEEEEGDGIKALAASDLQFGWSIIGEPTNLQPCLGSYGYLEIQILAKGRRIHASLANHGVNPIEAILRLIMRIAKYIETTRPQLIYNIRDLFTSNAGFHVPDHCEAWLDMHMPPDSHLGNIIAEIEELFEFEKAENRYLDGCLRFLTIDSGYELPEKGALIEGIKQIFARHLLPWEISSFRSHSDANRLWASGIRPILFGPGELEKAHCPEESISFKTIVKAAQVYFDIARAIPLIEGLQ